MSEVAYETGHVMESEKAYCIFTRA